MTKLLDVNLLIALLWDDHEFHERARTWLQKCATFATCPVSQLGFARISANTKLGYRVSPEHAFGILRRFLADPRHGFYPDDLSCADRALLSENIPGANHVTDHYLAALARRHGLVLATFDVALSRAFLAEPALVEIVR